jgi:hypothetical protein
MEKTNRKTSINSYFLRAFCCDKRQMYRDEYTESEQQLLFARVGK